MRVQAGALIDEERCGKETQARRMREGGEEQAAEERVGGGARDVALDLCACIFDQLVVLHAGWARSHAGHAPEAVVHVATEVEVEGRVTFGGGLHHGRCGPRGRVHLFSPENVGGAGGEAEAAVDAVGEEFLVGCVVRIERTAFGGLDRGELRHGRMPPRNRPGLRVGFPGSN